MGSITIERGGRRKRIKGGKHKLMTIRLAWKQCQWSMKWREVRETIEREYATREVSMIIKRD